MQQNNVQIIKKIRSTSNAWEQRQCKKIMKGKRGINRIKTRKNELGLNLQDATHAWVIFTFTYMIKTGNENP